MNTSMSWSEKSFALADSPHLLAMQKTEWKLMFLNSANTV